VRVFQVRETYVIERPLIGRGIVIRKLATELADDLDMRGLLGLDPSDTPGYERIRIRMHVEADCTEDELDALLAVAQAHSPVRNTVCRPVPVTIERV